MTMTDPIADMLTRLRNANQAYHDSVAMPYSKLKQGVADILKQEGYITSYDVVGMKVGDYQELLVMPGSSPRCAISRRQMRQRPNFL